MNNLKFYANVSFKIWLATTLVGLLLFFLICFFSFLDFDLIFLPIFLAFVLYSFIAIPLLMLSLYIIDRCIKRYSAKIIFFLVLTFSICTLLFELPFSILSRNIRWFDQIILIYFCFLTPALISSYIFFKRFFYSSFLSK